MCVGNSIVYMKKIRNKLLFLQGSFECLCPPNHTLKEDRQTCVPKKKKAATCPVMKRPEGAFFKCTHRRTRQGYHLGAKCLMKCRKGFTVGTPMRIKCTENGKWIGSTGACVPQTCPTLLPPKNGLVQPKSCTEGGFLSDKSFVSISSTEIINAIW